MAHAHNLERFADWQLADELATRAKRCGCDAFSASVNGTGPSPTPLQLDLAHALRLAATAYPRWLS